MQESAFTNYDQLPLFLNANTVAQVLGVSISSAYRAHARDGLPALHTAAASSYPKREFRPVGRCADRR